MKNDLLSSGLRVLSSAIQIAHLGHGSTWPGHLALKINPHFVEETLKEKGVVPIFIAGTNGKTTTARMLTTILYEAGLRVFQNESGANLLNGLASSVIMHSDVLSSRKETYAIFEVDENALPLLLKKISPKCLILLNLFRDQLDRYGEVRTIAAKWKEALLLLDETTKIVANGDDPEIVWVSEKHATEYFGLPSTEKKKNEHAADSIYCPHCGNKLMYFSVTFSHLGDWKCPSCGHKRPNVVTEKVSIPLSGSYNAYNSLAAYLTALNLGIDKKTIVDGLSRVTPAFGRQEAFQKGGRTVKIFLSKNPTGMNESLRTITTLGGRYLLFLLNDRVPDGRDVSWIWDVDIEDLLPKNAHIHTSGDRAYDMALRIKYAHPVVNHVDSHEHLNRAFESIVKDVPVGEILYVLSTYSAMLDVRKILTGRKIL